jgi:hypothetical protein
VSGPGVLGRTVSSTAVSRGAKPQDQISGGGGGRGVQWGDRSKECGWVPRRESRSCKGVFRSCNEVEGGTTGSQKCYPCLEYDCMLTSLL